MSHEGPPPSPIRIDIDDDDDEEIYADDEADEDDDATTMKMARMAHRNLRKKPSQARTRMEF